MRGSPAQARTVKTLLTVFFWTLPLPRDTAGMHDNIELLLYRTCQLLQGQRRICGLGLGDKLHYLAGRRVERNHGTHQGRSVKKMRVKNIKSHAEANTFLEKEYLPEHNRRFRRTPAQPEDYHRAGGGVGGSFSPGKRAGHRQRLGGTARQPIFPGASASPAVFAGQRESHGVRTGAWPITDLLSR
jgi:hypothetical protein